MKRDEFVAYVKAGIEYWLNNADAYDSDPQISVVPATLRIDLVNGSDFLESIADSDEAVESAAGVEGDASESSTDLQAGRDPDFYAVRSLVRYDSHGRITVDDKAVGAVADVYFS